MANPVHQEHPTKAQSAVSAVGQGRQLLVRKKYGSAFGGNRGKEGPRGTTRRYVLMSVLPLFLCDSFLSAFVVLRGGACVRGAKVGW